MTGSSTTRAPAGRACSPSFIGTIPGPDELESSTVADRPVTSESSTALSRQPSSLSASLQSTAVDCPFDYPSASWTIPRAFNIPSSFCLARENIDLAVPTLVTGTSLPWSSRTGLPSLYRLRWGRISS